MGHLKAVTIKNPNFTTLEIKYEMVNHMKLKVLIGI